MDGEMVGDDQGGNKPGIDGGGAYLPAPRGSRFLRAGFSMGDVAVRETGDGC
ncbi:hypothetical protein B0T14DRAFT_509619 [Immersiella caudata]|uniref:Uncharacterized protein n=1 Tax=Immersiella caudata TaxID=314043 RepID=A0AA39X2V2_9PEZI|nr:hypothetical protein B0T14DRAFT_509619 [Immersiella caudata]